VNGEDEMLVIPFRPRSLDFYLMFCLLEGGRYMGDRNNEGVQDERILPHRGRKGQAQSLERFQLASNSD
jgi:hypothetical protein